MGKGGNVARGLVPRWGRGVARQNPLCQTTTRAFSYLGVPAPAGPPTSTACVGAIRESPWAGPRQIPAGLHEAGRGKCSAGARPPL